MANTKNILKVLICCILTIIMIVPNMTVFAANGTADKNVVRSNITAIEKELLVNNTDVISEINAMIADYTSQSLNTTEDTDKIVGLIATLEEMRDEYTLYNAGISTYKFHAIYSPAVTAVVAFFNMRGYKLSAELLTHAKDNTKLNSEYSPTNGQRVKSSPTFTNIANGKKTSGSANFANSGTTAQKDLYYAIHAFSWTKPSASSRTVTIRDRYDFAPGDYNGIAGIAIDTMYKAQQAGVIIPYYIKITATA